MFDAFRTIFAYLDFSLINYGRGEVRSYSEAETDPSARTGSLKHPKNVEIKALYFEIRVPITYGNVENSHVRCFADYFYKFSFFP